MSDKLTLVNFGRGNQPILADQWYSTIHWTPGGGKEEPYNINIVYMSSTKEIRYRVESPWASSSEDFDTQPALPLEAIRSLLERLVEATKAG
jgi:hypothetical protein